MVHYDENGLPSSLSQCNNGSGNNKTKQDTENKFQDTEIIGLVSCQEKYYEGLYFITISHHYTSTGDNKRSIKNFYRRNSIGGSTINNLRLAYDIILVTGHMKSLQPKHG